ncbi:hypothetical protein [Mucilaginibacter sp.]
MKKLIPTISALLIVIFALWKCSSLSHQNLPDKPQSLPSLNPNVLSYVFTEIQPLASKDTIKNKNPNNK